MTHPAEIWGTGRQVTLRTVIRHAAELVHPKSHCGTYPVLNTFPKLKTLARALIEADHAGESTTLLHEIADELLALMKAARDSRQPSEKSTCPAQEILTRPKVMREQEQELKELRAKALAPKPAVMPALFELPAKPTKPKKTRQRETPTFFERGL
ncbi:hypothetical protein GO986_08890 [Deinococcus sp. HMF7620]|uniref:Uncharacterized protein n=1 Tax=Deinococcus arboris TaxID=2682977 RepID=A0A7C9M8F3_9DEIO|nr:hypothetical protein [Deinococcus arboris]MVN86879.1 hypothetical protein [Deinococcus arboris]